MMKKVKILPVLLLALLLFSCQNGEKADSEEKTTITIGVAASLHDVFTEEIIPAFEEEYPDCKVEANFAGSGTLKMQIQQGSDQDLFFSASVDLMEELIQEGLVQEDSVAYLLENHIVLAGPKSAKNGTVQSFEDMDQAQIIAMGNPDSAPVGAYGQGALETMGLWDRVSSAEISYGNDVSQVVSWIKEGSADVGLIYQSDAVLNEDSLEILDVARGEDIQPCIYPVAITLSGSNREEVRLFFEFLQREETQAWFEEYGFTLYQQGEE